MHVQENSVVTLNYSLYDADGELIEESKQPMTYLHGDFGGIFPKVQEGLLSKKVGEKASIVLDPEDAFGDYDAELLRVESRSSFPPDVVVGMQFEGLAEGEDETHPLVYTVTDIAEDKVVVDANHPLAGQRLRFECTIVDIRPATPEEVSHGHVHGPHGHAH